MRRKMRMRRMKMRKEEDEEDELNLEAPPWQEPGAHTRGWEGGGGVFFCCCFGFF